MGKNLVAVVVVLSKVVGCASEVTGRISKNPVMLKLRSKIFIIHCRNKKKMTGRLLGPIWNKLNLQEKFYKNNQIGNLI